MNDKISFQLTALTMRSISLFAAFLAICIAEGAGKISATEDVAVENLRKLALANNELAFNLHRRLAAGSSKNLFFSPLSISMAFGMLFYGARGDTAQELRNALGYEKAKLLNDIVHETFHRYFSDVLKTENSSVGYVLKSANAILADRKLELLEEYKQSIEELYRAVICNVDFSKDTSQIVTEINEWVKLKTNDKIEKLSDELSPDTLLVLLNAVYFKGTWKTQFDPRRTSKGVFYNNGLKAKNVSMMRVRSHFPVAFTEDFRAWELPYKGENISMLIFLPHKRDGLQALEESLTQEKLVNIQKQMHSVKMAFTLPKFKLEFGEELSVHLQALGAKRIFSAGADFSGMTPDRGVSVSQVLHKAVIEVNEEGSEATATTRLSIPKSRSSTFYVNHPFLFVIVEKSNQSNMILFMGRVNDL